jgi:hypothetical protein
VNHLALSSVTRPFKNDKPVSFPGSQGCPAAGNPLVTGHVSAANSVRQPE